MAEWEGGSRELRGQLSPRHELNLCRGGQRGRGRSFAVAGTGQGLERKGTSEAGQRGGGASITPVRRGGAGSAPEPTAGPNRPPAVASAHTDLCFCPRCSPCLVVHLPASRCFALPLFTFCGLCRCPHSLSLFSLLPFPQPCSFSWALVSATRGPAPALSSAGREEKPGSCAGERVWETGEPPKSGAL